MKEEIYTIPVNDGFNEDCECAFCAMKRKLEEETIDFVLSPSYMEEDVRGETNEKGFCQTHIGALYHRTNSLGLALILQSYLAHQRGRAKELVEASTGKKSGSRLFGSKKADADPIETYLAEQAHSCYICSRTETVMDRYMAAFFILYKRDNEFRNKVASSKGFCIPHFLRLYHEADKHLGGRDAESFRTALKDLEEKNLDRVAEDINWFTLKFDYRYQNEPWKNSKDAVPRTIQKASGRFAD